MVMLQAMPVRLSHQARAGPATEAPLMSMRSGGDMMIVAVKSDALSGDSCASVFQVGIDPDQW